MQIPSPAFRSAVPSGLSASEASPATAYEPLLSAATAPIQPLSAAARSVLPSLSPHTARLSRLLADERLVIWLEHTLGIANWTVADGTAAQFSDPGWIEFTHGLAHAFSVGIDLADYPVLASVAADGDSNNLALRNAVAAILLDELNPLFGTIGLDVQASSIRRGHLPADSREIFAISFQFGAQRVECLLGALGENCISAVEPCVAAQRMPLAEHIRAIRIPGRLHVGEKTLSIGKLRSLRAGDVLLRAVSANLRDWLKQPPQAGETYARWGEAGMCQLVTTVQVNGNTLTFLEDPTMADATDDEDLSVTDEEDSLDISELSLPVKFELDTVSLPVEQLSALRAGYVVELPVPIADARIRLTAYGQTIGFGELVIVGDHLGIRILRMSHDDGSV